MTAITPDEALLTLIELAELYERVSRVIGEARPSKFSALYVRRAAALRWVLAETAYGVDETTVLLDDPEEETPCRRCC